MTIKDLTGNLACWSLELQECDFAVTYRRGDQHANVDAVSRYPCDFPFANPLDPSILHIPLFVHAVAGRPQSSVGGDPEEQQQMWMLQMMLKFPI